MLNWPDVTRAGLITLRHAAAEADDTETIGLLRRAEALTRDLPITPDLPAGPSPVICPVFKLNGQVVRTISAVMRFGDWRQRGREWCGRRARGSSGR